MVQSKSSRLVLWQKGQVYGIDYEETFAPVAKFTSIRVLLSTAAKYNLVLQQMDVNTAFLNSDLDEDIYMQVPDGFDITATQDHSSKLVLKLKKSLCLGVWRVVFWPSWCLVHHTTMTPFKRARRGEWAYACW